LTGRPESEFPRLVDGGAVPSKSDDFGSVACSTYGYCSPELKSVSAGPGHYGNSVNTVSNSTGQSYVNLSSFTETLGASGCASGVVYNLSKDNSTWYYWNGSAWTLANSSVAQANAATVVNTNISTFSTQVGTGTLYFKAFLQSSVDGTSACSLSSVSVGGTK
jgi:hypothetical protein